MNNKNIYLIGFMGTGKSTVAQELHHHTGWEVIDTDAWIEQAEQMSIPEIFEKKGEAYFRALETSLLEQLDAEQQKIISCGGGIIGVEKNRALMKQNGIVVLLTATAQTILERVREDDHRPLLKGRKNVEAIQALLDERAANYEKAKQVTVATDDKTAGEIAKEILEQVR